MNENKPVAWMRKDGNLCTAEEKSRTDWCEEEYYKVFDQPLYTAPPSDAQDAQRYRWLREHSTQPFEPWSTHSGPESLDAAIDKAMKNE